MWLKTKVMLWKTLQFRKRHWFCTILEIVVPCVLFFITDFMETSLFEKTFVNQTLQRLYEKEQIFIDFKNENSSNYSFIFTPNTSTTKSIIEIVNEKLKIKNFTVSESEKEMVEKFKYLNGKDSKMHGFGIVFGNINLSNVFEYKIRNTRDIWQTNSLFRKFDMIETKHNHDVYQENGFIALQLALDEAFIELSKNNSSIMSNISHNNLTIKSYPYAKNLLNPSLQQSYPKVFFGLIFISFNIIYLSSFKRVAEEKPSGVEELMKIMGIKSWIIWTGWILNNFIVNVITIILIPYIPCLELHPFQRKLFYNTNPFLLCIILTMYMISVNLFCYAINSFFSRPLLAFRVGQVIWSFSSELPEVLELLKPSVTVQTIFLLSPNAAIFNAFKTILSLESQGKGLNFSTLLTIPKNEDHFSVGLVFVLLIIQCLLYGFIAWYMGSVMSRKYGIAKIFNFSFKRSNSETERNEKAPNYNCNSNFFENLLQPPNKSEVGISLQNLYKSFGNCNAVNGVNLDLYKGKITVLLGPNSAGKTTTISIITGLCTPTSGRVTVNGNDLFSNIDKYRDNFGVCLQHNILFTYLTALDHLIFFGMLKKMTLKKAQDEGLRLLGMLNILQKKDELVSELSGEMKRKLSLAIALVGDPDILILDEPTSGMDFESRREIWDILLSFKGSKTILIATQSMEEADVLGDKIAIMAHGKIQCFGTSLFLKKAYGTGYHLKLIKKKLCDESNSSLIEAVKHITPEAEIPSSLTAHGVINLPNEYTHTFPDVFRMLETNKKSCTIEEVFLKAEKNFLADDGGLISSNTTLDADSSFLDDESELEQPFDSDKIQIPMPNYPCGIHLLKNQFKILIKKKIMYTSRDWFMTLVFMIGPVMFSLSTVIYLNLKMSSANKNNSTPLNMSLSIYENSSVYYRVGDQSPNFGSNFITISEKNQANVYKISQEKNITNELLKLCESDVLKYRTNLMIAGDFNGNESTVIYNNIAVHTPAIAINLYSNALLQQSIGNNESYISTVNEPIKLNNTLGRIHEDDIPMKTQLNWLRILMSSFIFVIGYFIGLPLNERVSGIKNIQMMTKVSPIMYWATNFLWDYFCYILVITVTFSIIYANDVTFNVVTTPETSDYGLVVLLILTLLYGWSMIFYTYLYSFITETHFSALQLYILINSIQVMFVNSHVFHSIGIVAINKRFDLYNTLPILRYITLINPQCSFLASLEGFIDIRRKNQRIKLIPGHVKYKPKEYFVFKDKSDDGILEETYFLFFSGILYTTIILLLDYKIFYRVYRYCFNAIHGTGIGFIKDNEDPCIIDEKKQDETLSPLLLVDDLVKNVGKKFTGVRPGECYGLLGTLPSRGDASIKSDKPYKLSSNMSEYASMIGCCPQFDALNDKLTGKDLLKLMAILRGISPMDAKKHVNEWITLLSLSEYKDKLCGEYSGCNKRKLNVAMALIGYPPVLFLDEPTSELDPVARRNLCKDECEAFCNRLTIIKDGVMKYISDVKYLKTLYAQGFTIMIRLNNDDDIIVEKLKADIDLQFTSNVYLIYKNQMLLFYHVVNPNLSLSVIFDQMEDIKHNHSVVEDYTVNDMTFEKVFMEFAK